MLNLSMVSPPPTSARGRRPLPTPSLTAREHAVLVLVVDGLTNPQIAVALTNSPRTVQTHVRSLMRKFEAATRTELAVLALRSRTVPLELPDDVVATRPVALPA